MKKIGIFYGSTMGTTEVVAETIASLLGSCEVHNIADATEKDIDSYENLIFGSSTWGFGELQDDWYEGINLLDNIDFAGKKVAIFGLGDQESYSTTFVDAIGILGEKVLDKKGEIIGYCDLTGYNQTESKAITDGKFIGLPIDETNQSDLTDSRVSEWIKNIKKEFN